MTTTDTRPYKARLAEAGNGYWAARQAGDMERANAIWAGMGDIKPDPTPVAGLGMFPWSDRPGQLGAGGGTLHDTFTMAAWDEVDIILRRVEGLDVYLHEGKTFTGCWTVRGADALGFLSYAEGDLCCERFELTDVAGLAATTEAARRFYERMRG